MEPKRDEKGDLPAHAWPGGYPIYYLTADNGVLCPSCCNAEDEIREQETLRPEERDPQWYVAAADINWEDADLVCDHCGAHIEAAYAE